MLKLALVGAPYTGKSALAAALNGALGTPACAAPASASIAIVSAPVLAASLAGYDLVLLMGLELPVREPDMGDSPVLTARMNEAREAADQSIRAALRQAGMPYQVIYGSAEERLAHALAALEPLLKTAGQRLRHSPGAMSNPGSAGKTRPWVWVCDKCSDPQCEHRLLSDLLAGRARPV